MLFLYLGHENSPFSQTPSVECAPLLPLNSSTRYFGGNPPRCRRRPSRTVESSTLKNNINKVRLMCKHKKTNIRTDRINYFWRNYAQIYKLIPVISHVGNNYIICSKVDTDSGKFPCNLKKLQCKTIHIIIHISIRRSKLKRVSVSIHVYA